MTSGADTPAQLLDKLKNFWHDTHAQDIFRISLGNNYWDSVACGATIECTTTCAVWSDYAFTGSTDVLNYFLFTHTFVCTPFKWDPQNQPLGEGHYGPVLAMPTDLNFLRLMTAWRSKVDPPAYTLRLRYLDGIDEFVDVRVENVDEQWGPSGSRHFGWVNTDNSFWGSGAKDKVSFMRSMPQETPTLDNFSDSISVSIGANAGFMGEMPTVGVSASVSTSSSHSWSVPSVTVHDRMGSTHDEKLFVLNSDDARSNTFQMTVQELVSIKDDKTGSRMPGAPVGSRAMRNFELQIWPTFTGHNSDTNMDFEARTMHYRRSTGNDPHASKGDRRWMLQIPAPMLPGPA